MVATINNQNWGLLSTMFDSTETYPKQEPTVTKIIKTLERSTDKKTVEVSKVLMKDSENLAVYISKSDSLTKKELSEMFDGAKNNMGIINSVNDSISNIIGMEDCDLVVDDKNMKIFLDNISTTKSHLEYILDYTSLLIDLKKAKTKKKKNFTSEMIKELAA